MQQAKTKYFLAAVFALLLWSVILAHIFHLPKVEPLKGYVEPVKNISLNFDTWINGSYAAIKENYIKNTFALRPFFVRVYGQIKYSLFHQSTNHNVIIGKQNYMYERQYINAYNGDDFIGDSVIRATVRSLRELQDSLQTRGIFLFTVFAPGKGSFYPEYFPAELVKQHKQTNYETYLKWFTKFEINHLDFAAWFNTLKDTSRYLLFPRCGVHWSNYGEFIAFDSMLNYLNRKADFEVAFLKADSFVLSHSPLKRDYDLGDALNIFSNLDRDTLCYPAYSVSDLSKTKPKFLCIADSYYYQIYGQMSPLVFSDADFWYYFNELQNINKPTRHNNEVNLKDLILSKNIICLMYTDGQLTRFGNGFIDQALSAFKSDSTKKDKSAN